MSNKQKLELTWIGKEKRPRLEPRILLEDPEKSYHAKYRVSDNDIFDNRLVFGDNLLADDGSLWITIDDNEAHYLKVLCDEVFGRANFLANFIWQKSYGGGSKARWFVGLHEHLLCYAKDITKLADMWLPPDPEAVKKYYKSLLSKIAETGPVVP